MWGPSTNPSPARRPAGPQAGDGLVNGPQAGDGLVDPAGPQAGDGLVDGPQAGDGLVDAHHTIIDINVPWI